MQVRLHQPRRVVEVSGPRTVAQLLDELQLLPSTVLVIRGSALVTRDETLTDDDVVEVRPVTSGG